MEEIKGVTIYNGDGSQALPEETSYCEMCGRLFAYRDLFQHKPMTPFETKWVCWQCLKEHEDE